MLNHLKILSAQDAVAGVKSGDRIFIQGAAMTPVTLIDALCDRYTELNDVEIIQIHTEGKAKYTEEPYADSFSINTCFVAGNVRNAVNSNKGTYIPIFLSEIHNLFPRDILPLDVAFIALNEKRKFIQRSINPIYRNVGGM